QGEVLTAAAGVCHARDDDLVVVGLDGHGVGLIEPTEIRDHLAADAEGGVQTPRCKKAPGLERLQLQPGSPPTGRPPGAAPPRPAKADASRLAMVPKRAEPMPKCACASVTAA